MRGRTETIVNVDFMALEKRRQLYSKTLYWLQSTYKLRLYPIGVNDIEG